MQIRVFSSILRLVIAFFSLFLVPAWAQAVQQEILPPIDPSAVEREVTAGGSEGDDLVRRMQASVWNRGLPTADGVRLLLQEAAKQRQIYAPQLGAGGTGTGFWRPLGPTGDRTIQNGYTLHVVDSGRLRTILPHPTDESTLYVLSSGGGLWKTTNFNAAAPLWVPKSDFVGTTSGGSVAFGRSPDTLYLGLGDPFDAPGGAMVRSLNGGDSWGLPVFLGGATRVLDVKVDASSAADIVLVGTDAGLFRSVDGGTSYGPPAFPGNLVWSLARTSAGWLASVQTIDLAIPGIFTDGATTLYLSTDKGTSWVAAGTGFSLSAARTSLATGAPGDAIVYAFAAKASGFDFDQLDLFRSTDGGWTFVPLNITGKTPVNAWAGQPDMDLMSFQAPYNQLILVDPSDPSRNTVYLGGMLATAKTTDGGATWRLTSDWLAQHGLPYVHADCHAAGFRVGKKANTIFFGTDGGLFVSSDGGETFDSGKNHGLQDFLHYTLTSTDTLPMATLTGLQDAGTRFSPGSPTFNQVFGGDGIGTAWSQARPLVSMATVPGNRIYRCLDILPDDQSKFRFASRGISDTAFWFFTGLSVPSATTDPTGLIFLTWTPHKLFATVNGASSWFTLARIGGRIPAGSPPAVFRDVPRNAGFAPDDPSSNHLGAVLSAGRVVVTNDGGFTWSVSYLNSEVPGFASFTSNMTWTSLTDVYVSSLQPGAGAVRVVKSTASGSPGTWSAAQNGLPDLPVERLLADSRDATGRSLFAATLLGVYHTSDGGANWTLFGSGLPQVDVRDMYMPANGNYLRVATYGRGIWEIALAPR